MRETPLSVFIVINMKEQNQCKGAEKKEVSFERKNWEKEVKEKNGGKRGVWAQCNAFPLGTGKGEQIMY